MVKNIKLFCNNNDKSLKAMKVIRDKLMDGGFLIDDNNYELAIAVGGDGSFLRMVLDNQFNSEIYYIGVNTGTLGFLQELSILEIDDFIWELKNNKYKVEEIGIQETVINYGDDSDSFYSLNEIVVRDKNLGIFKTDIMIDGNLLEAYIGDGLMIATSTGSTAHNLSYGGSIVYNTFSSLQITPIAPINSKVYKSLINSVIIPDKMEISMESINKDLIVTVDGVNMFYDNVDSIRTKIGDKKIKCLRLNKYNFPQKINEKILNN